MVEVGGSNPRLALWDNELSGNVSNESNLVRRCPFLSLVSFNFVSSALAWAMCQTWIWPVPFIAFDFVPRGIPPASRDQHFDNLPKPRLRLGGEYKRISTLGKSGNAKSASHKSKVPFRLAQSLGGHRVVLRLLPCNRKLSSENASWTGKALGSQAKLLRRTPQGAQTRRL